MDVFELEVELRRALQRSLRHAIDEVLALPHGRLAREWTSDGLVEAVARCRSAIEGVKLFASEYGELAEEVTFSASSLRGALHALGVCEQLEEEVNFVREDLLPYVS